MDFNAMAIELAKLFIETIPTEYQDDDERKKRRSNRTPKDESELLIYFLEQVNGWRQTIKIMREKLPEDTYKKFIYLNPTIESDTRKVTDCSDFLLFTDYLIKRRDVECCGDDELGRLCMLLHEFQTRIEKYIQGNKKIKLKSSKAQALMEQKNINVNGIDLNLWNGHTRDFVGSQKSWNYIKSYSECNSRANGENGTIVLTGIMQIPRRDIADYAIRLGFFVRKDVTIKTDYLVVGSENVSPNEIAKMQELNEKGANIKLITENEFLSLVIDEINERS